MCGGGSVVEDIQTVVQAPIEAQESFVSSLDPNAGSVLNAYDNSAFSPLSSVGVLTGEVTSDQQYIDDTKTAAPYVAAGTAAVAGGYLLAGAGEGAAVGTLAEGSYSGAGSLGSGAFDYGAFAATAEAPVSYGLGGEALYYGGIGAANGAVTNAAAGAAAGGSSWWQAPLIGAVTQVGTSAALSALQPKPSSQTPQSVATARQPTASAPPVVNVGSTAPGKIAGDSLLNNPTAIGAVVLGIAAVGLSMKKARR